MIGYQNELDLAMEVVGEYPYRPGFFFSWEVLDGAFQVFTAQEYSPKRRVDESLWVYGSPGAVVGIQVHGVGRLLGDLRVAREHPPTVITTAMAAYFANYPQTIRDQVTNEVWAQCLRLVRGG